MFIILVALTKLKTPSKMENTEGTAKQQAKWENTEQNGLTPSKNTKHRAKLVNIK
jgi:hypothetical protein